MKLSGLTRESVLQAVQGIDIAKLAKQQLSSDYKVLINDQYYPFKLLVERSYQIATGSKLPEDTFKEYFYLSKQFTEFTGFKVSIAGAILLRKYVSNTIYILLSDQPLVHSMEDRVLDLSVLGPSFNDESIRKRKFRGKPGVEDILPGHLFMLITQESVYGVIQVLEDDTVERPAFPVKVLFLTPPLKHGIDYSEERYPLLNADYYDTNIKPLGRVIDQFDPALLEQMVEALRKK